MRLAERVTLLLQKFLVIFCFRPENSIPEKECVTQAQYTHLGLVTSRIGFNSYQNCFGIFKNDRPQKNGTLLFERKKIAQLI